MGIFETITNGFCGVEIGGIGTKMSILALLVSEMWRFYHFWGVLRHTLLPLGPNFGVIDNWECLKTIRNGLSGVENGGIGTKMSTLVLLVSEI